MGRNDHSARLFIEDFRPVGRNGVERIRVQNERTGVSAQKLRDMHIEPFAYPRAHSGRNTVRSKDIAVDRTECLQNDRGELPDGRRKQFFRDAKFGITGARFQTRARSKKRSPAVCPAGENICGTIRTFVRIGTPRRKILPDISGFPDLSAPLPGADPDIGGRHSARIIRTVGQKQRLFELPHGHRFVRMHADFRRNAALFQAARKIAGNDICSIRIDEVHERLVFAVDRAGKARSEQTVDNHAVPSARDPSELFSPIFFPHCRAIRRKLLGKTQNTHIFARIRQDPCRSKPVAAVVASAADEERVGQTFPLHRLRYGAR